jgi:hypothetical protein
MLKYLRYALTTFCFAASIGCLALWWRSDARHYQLFSPTYARQTRLISVSARCGECFLSICPLLEGFRPRSPTAFRFELSAVTSAQLESSERRLETLGRFGVEPRSVYFPLWYPALIFALVGVAALRLGRRFTIRSAIIGTSILCALLGMAVIL